MLAGPAEESDSVSQTPYPEQFQRHRKGFPSAPGGTFSDVRGHPREHPPGRPSDSVPHARVWETSSTRSTPSPGPAGDGPPWADAQPDSPSAPAAGSSRWSRRPTVSRWTRSIHSRSAVSSRTSVRRASSASLELSGGTSPPSSASQASSAFSKRFGDARQGRGTLGLEVALQRLHRIADHAALIMPRGQRPQQTTRRQARPASAPPWPAGPGWRRGRPRASSPARASTPRRACSRATADRSRARPGKG